MQRLRSRPKDFSFDELRTLLLALGYELCNKGKTSGSRVKFVKAERAIILHKPHPRKTLLQYQIKQLLEFLEEEDGR